MSDDGWDEWRDVAIFTCRHVLDGAPVLFLEGGGGQLTALCGAEDHEWLSNGPNGMTFVHCGHIFSKDPSATIVVDMPWYYCAKREDPDAPWILHESPPDEDEEDQVEDGDLYGLSRAEIRQFLDDLPHDVTFYRAENDLGAWLVYKIAPVFRAIPVWTRLDEAQRFVDRFSPEDRFVAMQPAEIIAFLDDFPEDVSYIYLEPDAANVCEIAAQNMFREVYAIWVDEQTGKLT